MKSSIIIALLFWISGSVIACIASHRLDIKYIAIAFSGACVIGVLDWDSRRKKKE